MNGVGGIDGVLSGGGEIDTFTISQSIGGISGGVGADQINLNAGTSISGNADGGADDDTFTIGGGAVVAATGGLTGGTGNDALVLGTGARVLGAFNAGGEAGDEIEGGDTATRYEITGDDSGTLIDIGTGLNRVTTFGGVMILTGGDGGDVFRFDGAGANLGTPGTNGTINGGGGVGVNTLEGSNGSDVIILDGTNSGTITPNGSAASTDFSSTQSVDARSGNDDLRLVDGASLANLSGGAGSGDTLTGSSGGVTFNVTGDDSGNVGGSATVTAWSEIENLNGTAGVQDDFVLDSNVTLSGNLDGGDPTDGNTLLLNNGSRILGTVSDVDVTLSAAGSAGNVDEHFTVQISGGVLQVVVEDAGTGATTTSSYFNPGAGLNVTLSIDADEGADTLTVDYSTGTIPAIIEFNVDTTNDMDADGIRLIGTGGNAAFVPTLDAQGRREFTIDTTNTVFVSTVAGVAFPTVEVENQSSFTFTSDQTTDDFELNLVASTTIGMRQGLELRDDNSIGISRHETIHLVDVAEVRIDLGSNDAVGGGSVDTLTIADGALRANASLTGLSISTGGAADIINLNETSYLNAAGTASPLNNGNLATGDATGIDTGDGADQLMVDTSATGDDRAISLSDTQLSLTDNGTPATPLGSVSLSGTAGDDLATLTGGTGDDAFNVDGWTSAAEVVGGTGTNSLTGRDEASTWDINANTGGTISNTGQGDITYSMIDELIGGTGNDTFIVDNAVTMLASIDGGAGGVNTLNLEAATVPLAATLTALGGGVGFAGNVVALFAAFDNITALQVPAGAGDSLTGRDATANWTLNLAGGTYLDSARTLSFSGFDSFQGGAGIDAFQVNANRTANILGGDLGDSVTIGAGVTLTGAVTLEDGDDSVSLANGSVITGVVSGGDGTDELSHAATSTTVAVSISAATTGVTGFDGTTTGLTSVFTGIDTFTGGTSGTDTFTSDVAAAADWILNAVTSLTTSSRTATISGFDTLSGGTSADNDRFEVAAGATALTDIDGGGGTNTLIGNASANVFTINDSDAGQFEETGGGGVTLQFEAVGLVEGAAGNDVFAFDTLGTLSGGGNAIDGGADSDTITGDADGTTFNVNAVNQGTVDSGAGVVNFTRVENLTGGAGDDSFTINNRLDGVIRGDAGDDQFTLNTGTLLDPANTVQGGDGEDTFNLTGTVTANLGGGNDADVFVLAAGTVSDRDDRWWYGWGRSTKFKAIRQPLATMKSAARTVVRSDWVAVVPCDHVVL